MIPKSWSFSDGGFWKRRVGVVSNSFRPLRIGVPCFPSLGTGKKTTRWTKECVRVNADSDTRILWVFRFLPGAYVAWHSRAIEDSPIGFSGHWLASGLYQVGPEAYQVGICGKTSKPLQTVSMSFWAPFEAWVDMYSSFEPCFVWLQCLIENKFSNIWFRSLVVGESR